MAILLPRVQAQDIAIAGGHIVCAYDLPESVDLQVQGKLNKVLSHWGLAFASAEETRFAFIPNLNINNVQTSGGIPAITKVDCTLDLQIIDFMTGKLFGSYAIELKGRGANKVNALSKAIAQANLNTARLRHFVQITKEKILAHYDAIAPHQIAKAKRLSQQKRYAEAMQAVAVLPTSLYNYPLVEKTMMSIYQDYVDAESLKIVRQAKGLWLSKSDLSNVEEVLSLLAEVPEGSKYNASVSKLLKQIELRAKKFENPRWALAHQRLKERQEELKFKHRMAEKSLDYQHSERLILGAYSRDIALALAKQNSVTIKYIKQYSLY